MGEVCKLMSGSKLLIAEPVGTEQGDVLIPCYDWQAKFASLGKISGRAGNFWKNAAQAPVWILDGYLGPPGTRLEISIIFFVSISKH